MTDIPTFEEFYEATHKGRGPFPWQKRLARLVASEGWPREIGIPTGLGKTACLDIAVWALASQSGRDPRERTAATRTWYVVNRRLLVDAAFDHGESLMNWLETPASLGEDWPDASADHIEVIDAVGQALRNIAALGSQQGPLHVTRLRGGADLGARVPDPSQPALVFATVPMFASRWLFRGFGSSNSMRPVDAALAGIDSLVLLDEAHLAQPLARLGEPLAQCDVGKPERVLPVERARPRFVALTATGKAQGDRFDLNSEDQAHRVIRQRLDASKPCELVPSKKKTLTTDLAETAIGVLGRATEPTSCLVFANTPETARSAYDHARSLAAKQGIAVEPHLLTGRMREREAGRERGQILDKSFGAPSDRDRAVSRDQHLLVVATQTLEVGADVDFDHLVTETAGVRSLVQRFGRLNRLGHSSGSTATVLHPVDWKDRPVYGAEPEEVWKRLEGASEGGELSLGPAVIADVLGEPDDEPPRVGELLPHHLWDWAKTSEPRQAETPPELFYDELDDTKRVSVLWRSYIPGERQGGQSDSNVLAHDERPDGAARSSPDNGDGSVLVPSVHGDEAVDLPLRAVQGALEERGIKTIYQLQPDGKTIKGIDHRNLRPGTQLMLSTQDGLYDAHGWNPDSRKPVLDLSLIRAGLVLDIEVIKTLFDLAAEADSSESANGDAALKALRAGLDRLHRTPDDEEDNATVLEEQAAGLTEVMRILAGSEPPTGLIASRDRDEPAQWNDWHQAIIAEVGDPVDEDAVKRLAWLDDGTPFIDVSRRLARAARQQKRAATVGIRSDAYDELSFSSDVKSPELDAHLGAVGGTAALIAGSLGLPDELVTVVEGAGATHDLGKLESRFQRWLNPDPSGSGTGSPLAKSGTPWHRREATRKQARWPQGGRHELLSARLLEAALDREDPWRDLLLHLVISHHGHGRPLVGVTDDEAPTKLRLQVQGSELVVFGDQSKPGIRLPPGLEVRRDSVPVVSGDLSQPDWDQSGRFRRMCELYGYWGLALLEAIVRQADHAVSARAQVEVA